MFAEGLADFRVRVGLVMCRQILADCKFHMGTCYYLLRVLTAVNCGNDLYLSSTILHTKTVLTSFPTDAHLGGKNYMTFVHDSQMHNLRILLHADGSTSRVKFCIISLIRFLICL